MYKPIIDVDRLVLIAKHLHDEWIKSDEKKRAEYLKSWRAMWWLSRYLREGERFIEDHRSSDLWETLPEEARFESKSEKIIRD